MKNYNEMTNEEKAQAIYNKLKDQSLTTLSDLLVDLSKDYTGEAIFTVDDWLEYEEDTEDLSELIRTAQQSKELDIDKKYIRESIYYYGYKTSDNALDLVDDEELEEWIENAIEDNNPIIEDAINELEIEAMQKGLEHD